jgi:molybdenum cofactor cytidylyltransferase
MRNKSSFNIKHSAIILSAGKSERFGQPKFMLPLPNGKIFLENIIDSYLDFNCEQVIVVLNQQGIEKIEGKKPNLLEKANFIVNNSLHLGRFFSIKLGVSQFENQSSIFIHNVDNPFASKNTLLTLSQKLNMHDFVFPGFEGKGGHPILVNRRIIESILIEEAADINFKSFLRNFNGQMIDVNEKHVTLNINIVDEYESMLREYFSPT